MSQIRTPKKLIEVALPLDDINVASAREKSIRHGHPSTLHLWWARRPLAAARAVIFAQMVNDPGGERGYYAGKPRAQADAEREELFQIMRDLVLWENTNNADVLARARAAIHASWRETCALNKSHPQAATLFNPDALPAFHDPFAGGGALPLEAQRLGLESFASDLNPVAVTINKAMIEIPPKFAGRAPVGPLVEAERGTKKATQDAFSDWAGAKGLAEDVRRYGAWMREQAQTRIGHLYPSITVTSKMIAAYAINTGTVGQKDIKNQGFAAVAEGQQLTVIAWLWARTVKSPNPAFSHVDVPLASTFILSSKAGKEAYVQPVVTGDSYHFEVRTGTPPDEAKGGTTAGKRAAFTCLMSGVPIDYKYIRAEGAAGRMGQRLMAIVAEGQRGRIYLPPLPEHEATAAQVQPTWKPDTPLHGKCRVNVSNYGLDVYGDLFTPRQLVALTTFSDLVPEAVARIRTDALAAGMADDGRGLDAGGTGATAYAEAVGVYLGFSIDKASDYWSSICTWHSSKDLIRNTFGRQAIPMTWDYAETNPFSDSAGNASSGIDWAYKALQLMPAIAKGLATQADAQTQTVSAHKVVSTDPPYCLVPDTLIQTREGYRRIEDIRIGDDVLTHTGRFAKVTHTFRRWYSGPMQQLGVAHCNAVLQITPEHPIYGIQTAPCGYTMDYCRADCSYLSQQGRCRHQAFADYKLDWIAAGQVKRHDLIFQPDYVAVEQAASTLDLRDWLPAADYLEQDGCLHYQKASVRSLDRRTPAARQYQLPTRVAISPALCVLVGLFAAEGYAQARHDGGTIQFVFHQDETALMDEVKQAMRTCFGLSSGLDTHTANSKAVRLNFYSKPLAQVFRAWFYDAQGFKRLPVWLLDLPASLQKETLRGYWLGDGCRRPRVYEASTNSAALAGQLRLLLQRLGVVARLHVNEKRMQYQSVVNGAVIQARGPCYQIIVTGHTLPLLADIVGPPKKGVLHPHLRRSHGHDWTGGRLLPIRQATTVAYSGWVHNIETEDHSYVTAAGCVHNCDNIGYADLSDFFYVWLRRSLKPIFPQLYGTLAVPKAEELVATPYRHGGKDGAMVFFMNGMEHAIHQLAQQAHPAFPVTIYYAYKQSQEGDSGTVSMGWDSFLEAVLRAGFALTGTWPMRTELGNRMIGSGTNALASSIVLVCRPRDPQAETISRREFQRQLREQLPEALDTMIGGSSGQSPIAPVDLAQAAIGPGMAIYSQYAAVLNQDGTPMTVHDALVLINRQITDHLTPDAGNFDADTLFANSWFEQYGWSVGAFGEADVLARGKGTSVQGVADAGVVESGAGKVRLLRWAEYAAGWNPATDTRAPVWEATHHLIRALNQQGETAAGALLAAMPDKAEPVRQLAYHLYTLCERKKWADDARAYNELITAWHAVAAAAREPIEQPLNPQLGLEV